MPGLPRVDVRSSLCDLHPCDENQTLKRVSFETVTQRGDQNHRYTAATNTHPASTTINSTRLHEDDAGAKQVSIRRLHGVRGRRRQRYVPIRGHGSQAVQSNEDIFSTQCTCTQYAVPHRASSVARCARQRVSAVEPAMTQTPPGRSIGQHMSCS